MKLNKITFTLENCDRIEFNSDTIKMFKLQGVNDNINYINSDFSGEYLDDYSSFKSFVIELNSDANCKDSFMSIGDKDCQYNKFDRLIEWDDITSIDLEFIDKGENESAVITKSYRVEWNKNNIDYMDYSNANIDQTSYIADDGNLYIVIDSNATVGDYFQLDYPGEE